MQTRTTSWRECMILPCDTNITLCDGVLHRINIPCDPDSFSMMGNEWLRLAEHITDEP